MTGHAERRTSAYMEIAKLKDRRLKAAKPLAQKIDAMSGPPKRTDSGEDEGGGLLFADEFWCFAAAARLAEYLGCATSSVNRHLKQLREPRFCDDGAPIGDADLFVSNGDEVRARLTRPDGTIREGRVGRILREVDVSAIGIESLPPESRKRVSRGHETKLRRLAWPPEPLRPGDPETSPEFRRGGEVDTPPKFRSPPLRSSGANQDLIF